MPTSTTENSVLRRALSGLPRLRNRHFLLIDLFWLSFIPTLALMIRLDGASAITYLFPSVLLFTAGYVSVTLAVFWAFGLYHRYWRYATVDELVLITGAVAASTVTCAALYYASSPLKLLAPDWPRSIPFISGLLTLVLTGGVRFSVRLSEQMLKRQPVRGGRGVLIVGAGFAGQSLVKELQVSRDARMSPIGYVDDDASKQGVKIAGLPVLGSCAELVDVARHYDVSEVIIAMPSAPGIKIRSVLDLCEQAGVSAKILPAMSAILNGKVRVSQIRNVDIEDLLRREPIETDIAAVRELVRGKRVLITGGGGSIGSELCRQLSQCGTSDIALLGHGENSIFDIHNELRREAGVRECSGNGESHHSPVLHAIIADIRSASRIRSVIRTFAPDIIFHAAAHKHVPLMEHNPTEAVSNNVLGTRNLLDAALESNVEHFVMISTDKAVNPTSVMGASKRAAELLVLAAARKSGRRYVAVRFGNVLGSRGSVIPVFKRQIAGGGPVTVSHPDMRRYFMTIPEAVQLVLQASVLGQSGGILMLDMGEPVKIVDLAKTLIELSGLVLDRDIKIAYTGIRPGEKLHEELYVPGESYQPTRHEKILLARNASSFVPDDIEAMMSGIERAVNRDDGEEVIRLLVELIPEFEPQGLREPALAGHAAVSKARTSRSLAAVGAGDPAR